MEHPAKFVFTLVAAALALGIADDLLFQSAAWGINVALGLLILVAVAALAAQRTGARFPARAAWAVLPALLAAGGFALRDSPVLLALGTLVFAACVLLALGYCRTGGYGEPGFLGSLRATGTTAKDALGDSVQFVRRDIPQAMQSGTATRSPHGRAVGRGLLLALPLLAVFGGLFASADPVFARLLSALFQWDLERFWLRCAWIAVGTCLAGGLLRLLLRAELPPARPDPAPRALAGRVETAVVLGALDALFLLFVLVQFRYFFGGRETVQATVGMTYAAYARHGFFELATVSALALPLLLALHAWQERRPTDTRTLPAPQVPALEPMPAPSAPSGETLFRGLAGLLLLLLFVIMASALVRMSLYRSEYGLTELRVYTTAFMGWLAVVFAWFGLSVLRGHRRRFAGGAFASACFAVGVLFAWNPDARIVAANAALAQTARPGTAAARRFDADYAVSLSDDAVPALVAVLPRLSPEDRQAVAMRLLRRSAAPQSADWRAWCWGRRAAQQAVARSRARLLALSPPDAPVLATSATQTVTVVTPVPPR